MFILGGLVLPVVCFLLAWEFHFADSWQSGEFHAVTGYLLWKAAWPFYPLLLYAAGSLTAIMWRHELRHFALLRFGIYSGIPLAVQFIVLENATITELRGFLSEWLVVLPFLGGGALISGALIWGLPKLVFHWGKKVFFRLRNIASRWLHRRSSLRVQTLGLKLRRYCGRRFFNTTVILLLIGGSLVAWPITVLGSLAAAPVWALMIYFAMTVRLLREEAVAWRFRLLQLMGIIAYLSVWLAAWRQAARIALAEYALLPTEPPSNCYVATAAAGGHARLVGRADQFANRQLRTLKAFEIVLAANWPALHRKLRAAYDRLGPPVAARLKSPWLADLAYLSLKPAQWIAAVVLRCLALRRCDIEQLYRG